MDWLNSDLSPVVYGDIALSINTEYNTIQQITAFQENNGRRPPYGEISNGPNHLMNVTTKNMLLHKDTVIGQLPEIESIKVLFQSQNGSSHPILGEKDNRVHKAAISCHEGQS